MSKMQLTFEGGNEVQFEKDEKTGLKKFSMQGYSGALMESPYGNVIINLEGMKARSEVTPIFQHHDRTLIVGHATAEIGDTVQLSGTVSGTGDAAKEVVETSERGFPWQASVGIDIFDFEELAAGADPVVVNGHAVSGPAVIFQQSEMFESSFVPLGRDKDTPSVIFSQDAQDSLKSILAAKETKKEHGNMSEKNKDEAVAITAETLEAAKQEAVTQTAERMTGLLSEFSQDVALAAFADNLSVADVKVQQYDKLKTRVAELEAEVASLKLGKPAAEGEATPVEHAEAPKKTNGITLFEKSVDDYKKAGKGTREAFALAAADHPEIANKMALGQK